MTSRRAAVALTTAAALLATGCGGGEPPPDPPGTEDLSVTSSAFQAGGTIPEEFTCDVGDMEPPFEDMLPPLVWSGEPEGTAGFAIIVSDPDAAGGEFIHWIAFDIPATEHGVDFTAGGGGVMVFGENSFGQIEYDGPCPPEGDEPHRYRFTVYALSRLLGLERGVSYGDVRAELEDAAIASGTLEGTYGR